MKPPWQGRPVGCLAKVFLRSSLLTRQQWRMMVGRRFLYTLSILFPLAFSASPSFSQDPQEQKLDRQFQSAVASYDAGHFAEAAAQLETLLPYAKTTFEIHELLGICYASQSQDAKALPQLEIAVRLKPDSAAAHTNLAASLVHAGKAELAAEHFRKALSLAPQEYDANHNLGEFYIQSGKIKDALPLLEKAQLLQPSSYDNGYDLALADFLAGLLSQARTVVQSMLQQKNTGELHNLLGQIDEKDGKYVAAANEFEVAAHLDPSEDNLFDWGSELMLHRTYEPAIDIFKEATRRYPTSPRLMTGFGMALDLLGKYDEAVKALLAAADLDPSDPRCYLYLSKAFDSSPTQAEDVIQRFHRYAALKPDSALAQYYYAMSLWKGKRGQEAGLDLHTVESLLQRAIELDGTIAEPHVELGNLYADQRLFAKSLPEYKRALELNPNLPDAHYRLGQDYVHLGQKEQAQSEFDVYQRLRAEHLAQIDKEKADVQQFVYAARSTSTAKP